MNALTHFDALMRVAMNRVLIKLDAQLADVAIDTDLQFRAARAEVHGFSFTRSLGQQRRHHRMTNGRTTWTPHL